MKAVVLVGGQGTRLRPLTDTIKKELLPLMGRAMLHHTLDHLARHGVQEVVLSSSYLEETFRSFLEERGGSEPRVTWLTEETALDTAGAIIHALDQVDGTFFALNGDILTDLDLEAMLAFHREHGAAATIALSHVDDARAFGLVATGDGGRILEFREKPAELVPGDINAGTYILEPKTLARWPRGEAVNIERVVFPALIESGRPVYGYLSDAYWLDLGTPQKYLQAHFDMLEGRIGGGGYPSPYVAHGAVVDREAHLGPRVVVGSAVRIYAGANIEDSVLLPGAVVGPEARVAGSILGPGCEVGAAATVTGCTLAEDARISPGVTIADAKVPGD